jgi:hypothetical protein
MCFKLIDFACPGSERTIRVASACLQPMEYPTNGLIGQLRRHPYACPQLNPSEDSFSLGRTGRYYERGYLDRSAVHVAV